MIAAVGAFLVVAGVLLAILVNRHVKTIAAVAAHRQPSSATQGPSNWEPPFEYRVVEHQVSDKFNPRLGLKQHDFRVETPLETAKTVSEENLRDVWEHHFLTIAGDDTWAFVDFFTPGPVPLPWAQIRRLPGDELFPPEEWETKFIIHEQWIEQNPYHFVERIDRSVVWQRAMLVNLPTLNTIRDNLLSMGWNESERKVDYFSAESPSLVGLSLYVTPESVNVDAYSHLDADREREFWLAAETALEPLGLWQGVTQKRKSVLGSTKYLAAERGPMATWHWRIVDAEVTYMHMKGRDSLTVMFAR